MAQERQQFIKVQDDLRVKLDSKLTGKTIQHRFEKKQIQAINTAIACNRPLLLTGDPGVGKSQLARAAAAHLKRVFIAHTVDAKTEAHDLLWQFDAIGRLADAQISSKDNKIDLSCSNYIKPGALWWGFNWKNAQIKAKNYSPNLEGEASADNGAVILIDEIDKAEIDIPNSLLEILGDGSFHPEGMDEPVYQQGINPLVVITSNRERSLPDAFVRRCVVLEIKLPEDEKKLKQWLVNIGQGHCKLEKKILEQAADYLIKDRRELRYRYKSGQAEYLDMLRAIEEQTQKSSEAEQLLDDMRLYLFQKGSQLSV